MSGPPRVKSMNYPDSEARPVLGPAGNKARSVELRKPVVSKPKSHNKVENALDTDNSHGKKVAALPPSADTSPQLTSPVGQRKTSVSAASILRQQDHKLSMMRPNLSLNASCSSDASSDSSQSRASTGRIRRQSLTPTSSRKKQFSPKLVKAEKTEKFGDNAESVDAGGIDDASATRKRCAWVTPTTDPSYAAFHDEEWGVPVHDDKKLFELLILSTALAELTWPTILNKRHLFREVFQNFDPISVSKLNEKKIAAPGGTGSSLLSELRLRATVENARQICKIIEEFGSFDKYIWGFVNYTPIVSNFRYPRQVPIKTSKADAISKDLVRRGFRGVGPTVVYSFMQVAGITNDHLLSCFRFQDCVAASEVKDKDGGVETNMEEKRIQDESDITLMRAIDDLSLSS